MKLIAIAGMHRSGTSFVTELICEMGAEAGGSLLEKADDNPHGFFENQAVKELDDVVLRRLGGTWDRPPLGLSSRWQDSPGLDAVRRSAEEAIASLVAEAGDAPAAVIKDPRLSLTLPFWRSVATLDSVVVPLRAPVEVAQSLRHRNGFSPERSAELWIRYTVDALLSATSPVIVPFHALVEEPAETICWLAKVIGLEDGAEAAVQVAANRTRTWKPADHFTDVPGGDHLRLATSLFEMLVATDSVDTLVPVLETIAANWRLGASADANWSKTSGVRLSESEALAERYRDLRVEFEDLSLRAREFEEGQAIARRELRTTTERLAQETQALQAAHHQLTEASERSDQLRTQLEQQLEQQLVVTDEERERRVNAEERASAAEQETRASTDRTAAAEQATRVANERAEAQAKRARVAERNFKRLRSRRSVRLAAAAARPFRPVFRAVRRVRNRKRSTPAPSTSKQKGPAPGRPASDNGIQRTFDHFPKRLDTETRVNLRRHGEQRPQLSETLVSIVMPTYNRADQIGDAIQSVMAQTHPTWELLVVDDGSDDDTPIVMSEFSDRDPRIRYIENPRGGVSAARNTGLDAAAGEIIAFLDTDNAWDREYLSLMVAELDRSGADIAYSAMQSVQDGKVVSYRGDRFDADVIRRGNYVDLNVICHHRRIIDDGARFDAQLRRMVDWDYLLRISRSRNVSYTPFLGGIYTLHQEADQISNQEPYLYRKVVATRHRSGAAGDADQDAVSVFRGLELDIAICLAAPRGKRNEWGDYHFGSGLAQAFERHGHRAKLYYYDETVDHPHDLVISLRGLTGHTPPPNSFHVIWSISHPDLLSWDEIERCDLFFSASLTWPQMLDWATSTQHHVLPQATDRARFHPHTNLDRGDDILFVGNSRDAERPIVTKAAASGLPLSVYGTRWSGRIPDSVIKGEYIPNEQLTRTYAGAGVVLNDHWESMRDFGYVSNRVFDVVASGGRLLSDDLAGLRRIFGDVVTTVGADDEFDHAVERASTSTTTATDANWVLDHHTFDNRASQVLDAIEQHLFRGVGDAVAGADDDTEQGSPTTGTTLAVRGSTQRLRLAVAPQTTPSGFTSSAYIRLAQPLTSEIPGFEIDLHRVDTDGGVSSALTQLDGADAFVVSRTALTDAATATEWLDAAATLSIPVVLDVDDAFHHMDGDHPEYDLYKERIEALMLVMERAAEIWTSTEPLAASISAISPHTTVVPNSLDPRLWRRYRPLDPAPTRDGDHGLEILYAGSATHGSDLESILPALDDLAAKTRFRLTVVGVAPHLAKRSWIRRLAPAQGGQYPRYATWIRDIAPLFDVGIAPLVDNEFNGFKSDVKLLEYLALGLVPLASDVGPYTASRDLAVGGALSTNAEWTGQLAALAKDKQVLATARDDVETARETVWTTRNAAATGAFLADRVRALIS